MKQPTTAQELKRIIPKLEKANKKWFDTERERLIKSYKEKLYQLEN